MMCPNKNHPDWKALEATYGTTQAFRYWMAGLDSQSKVDNYTKSKEVPINLQPTSRNKGRTEQELIEYLKEKYPEIKLEISNNPVWEQGDNVFNQKEYNNQVQYRLKAVNTLVSDKAKQIFEKGKNNNWGLNKILTELQISKEQKQIILDKDITDREEIIASLLADNSFVVEINTAKSKINLQQLPSEEDEYKIGNDVYKRIVTPEFEYVHYKNGNKISEEEFNNVVLEKESQYYSYLTVPGGANYTENEIVTPAIKPAIKGHAQFATDNGIGWFRSDEQRVGGKTATEMGADDFIEGPNGRKINPDNVTIGGKDTKTRRILELQSDLFQKGRNRKDLITNPEVNALNTSGMRGVTNMEEMLSAYEYSLIEYENKTKEEADELVSKERKRLLGLSSSKEGFNENKFLQLLNKKGNWVNFFIQSIIQDSAKKGYEKVLFPKGDTISKIEGHTTLEEFKKQKEDRIKEIEKQLEKPKYVVDWLDTSGYGDENIIFETEQEAKDYVKIENAKLPEDVEGSYILLFNRERLNNEINQLKQEIKRVEEEGFGALRPIYDFYENRVTNTLNKLYDVKEITDEYGNKWNEITITPEVLSEIMLQRNEANQIIGQANIKAMTVLVDAVNKKADTIPHEYAHHYISWFRDTPIVQEGIKRFGSEEALVQAIGEQVVKQKGEAYNWWKKFTNWILNLLSDRQLLQILTDSFLNRQDLNEFTYNNINLNKENTQPEVEDPTKYKKIYKGSELTKPTNPNNEMSLEGFKEGQKGVYEVFEENKELLESEGITAEMLIKSISKNKNSISDIENWINNCLKGRSTNKANINTSSLPKAEQGMKSSKFTKGGKWRLIKDLQGYPTHEKGGVDLMIGKDGVSITSGQSNFKAEYGLVLPKAQQGMVIGDPPSNYQNQQDWQLDYINSPQYKQILTNEFTESGMDPNLVDKEIARRAGRVSNVSIEEDPSIGVSASSLINEANPNEVYADTNKPVNDYFSLNPADFLPQGINETLGLSPTPSSNLSVNPDLIGSNQSDVIRELAKASTAGNKGLVSSTREKLMNATDVADLNAKAELPVKKDLELNKTYSAFDNPTRIHSQLTTLKKLMQDEGIYNPMIESATPEHIQQMLQNPNIINDPNIRELIQLNLKQGTDIGQLLNSVASNNNQNLDDYV